MGDQLWVGTRKGLFRVERAGEGWHARLAGFEGDPVTALLTGPDQPWLAGINLGHFGVKLHRSEDRGGHWTETTAPSYPPRPADAPADLDPVRNEPIPWSLKTIWELVPGRRAGRIWCGSMPGGLFLSEDAGQTWTLNRALWDHPLRRHWMGGGADWPGIHSIWVDPRDPDRVGVAVSCGGVMFSEDGGSSWRPRTEGMFAEYMPPDQKFRPEVQDPHRVVQCEAAPQHLWCQHHNGIFRSTDGGISWTAVTAARPSAFGFAVAVHPRDPDRAWFVPAIKDEKRYPVDGRLVVSRTRDGGASFEILERGLPTAPAYDLVYRHALAIDATGERLAMASTTGALWVSEDGGDLWSLVSAHLPPVNCLEFAA